MVCKNGITCWRGGSHAFVKQWPSSKQWVTSWCRLSKVLDRAYWVYKPKCSVYKVISGAFGEWAWHSLRACCNCQCAVWPSCSKVIFYVTFIDMDFICGNRAVHMNASEVSTTHSLTHFWSLHAHPVKAFVHWATLAMLCPGSIQFYDIMEYICLPQPEFEEPLPPFLPNQGIPEQTFCFKPSGLMLKVFMSLYLIYYPTGYQEKTPLLCGHWCGTTPSAFIEKPSPPVLHPRLTAVGQYARKLNQAIYRDFIAWSSPPNVPQNWQRFH